LVFYKDFAPDGAEIPRRGQFVRAGAEGDVGAFRVVRQWLRTVPRARATVDAFLTVEPRHATITGRDGWPEQILGE
jgi:hypothetical protein